MRPVRIAAWLAGVLAGVLLITAAAGPGAVPPAAAARVGGGPAGYLSVPGILASVAATSARRAWAVGGASAGGDIAVWNGTRWKLTQPPGQLQGGRRRGLHDGHLPVRTAQPYWRTRLPAGRQ